MSIRAIDWAFRQATGSSASKLVLIKLADNANDDGRCYPSLAYIAAHCEMHRGTVIRHIKALSDCGLIEVEHRSVDGSKIPNVYRLKLQPVVAECNQGSRTLQPGVVAECNQGSRTLQHRTVIEPSVEPKILRRLRLRCSLKMPILFSFPQKNPNPPPMAPDSLPTGCCPRSSASGR